MKTLRATRDGEMAAIQMVGFHGRVHPRATPARRSPVYVDEERCLLRIIEVRPDAEGADVVVETVGSPIPTEGDLPGHGTRVGPWPARLDHLVIIVGPEEIERASQLKPHPVLKEPETVERFVRWLSRSQDQGELKCQWLEPEKAAAWYCSKAESSALFHRIHDIAEDELFAAAALFKAGRGSKLRLEAASFWLSRAAIRDTDIYRAAAGLRRAASSNWELVLREGLRLWNNTDKDWKPALDEADQLLDSRPVPIAEQSAPKAAKPPLASSLRDDRDAAKRAFQSQPRKRVAG